ncbi:MAG: helix-hairpin-helix domain-containing protein [Clostridium sp.]|nr:helix-hairpin-helix domain-containing protein [Acetatifactor muris]MCM1526187.1 helix-hairpin-helix domain-containing protein [Bacteroides sp.]MCM1562665.1 helix-hairpin-helix domain-containing protein [Clostridium sp.]
MDGKVKGTGRENGRKARQKARQRTGLKAGQRAGLKAVGRFLWSAGILLCLFGLFMAGCGRADRALTLPLGEPVTMETDADRAGDGGGSGSAQGAMPGAETASGGSIRSDAETLIYIHVCGAVNSPGVVCLPEGSRVQDALEAAGGLTEDGAAEAVNLAATLADGTKLYFPTREEANAGVVSREDETSGLININTADEGLLCELPGIGEAKAKAIVAYREENGVFEQAQDIMNVPGIKENAYGRIKELITVR